MHSYRNRFLLSSMMPSLLALIAICCIRTAEAANDEQFKDSSEDHAVWEKSKRLFNDELRFDTQPIDLIVGKVHYRIPRNYLVHGPEWLTTPEKRAEIIARVKAGLPVEDGLLTLRVTFPGYKPYSEETKSCLVGPLDMRPRDCLEVTFNIGNAEGEVKEIDDVDWYLRVRHALDVKPEMDQWGYFVYKYGVSWNNLPFEVRYKKTELHNLIFTCSPGETPSGLNLFCSNSSRISDGNGISYLWFRNSLEHAAEVDSGIRALVESFIVREDRK